MQKKVINKYLILLVYTGIIYKLLEILMPVYKFTSPAHFAKECAKIPASSRMQDDASAKSWTGETFKESVDGAIYGNNKYVEAAEQLLDKLYTEIDVPYPSWQPSMMGAYPSVPSYLMGEPESMMTLTPEENSRSPITIYYVSTSSAGHKWEDLLKRGIATLAFAMVLSKTRPVNLKIVATLDGASSDKCTLIETNIDLNNVSLSTAAFAIASTGYDRNLTHTYGHHHNGFSGHWAWFSFPSEDNQKFWTNLRHHLKMQEDDILIKGAFLEDKLILEDPIAWCKLQIKQYQAKEHADVDFAELVEDSEYKPRKMKR